MAKNNIERVHISGDERNHLLPYGLIERLEKKINELVDKLNEIQGDKYDKTKTDSRVIKNNSIQ